jgi:DNA ligase-1
MRLAEIASTSQRVAQTRSRLEKIGRLAELLGRLRAEEVLPGASYLMGELPQGRIGLGPAAVHSARPGAVAAQDSLELVEVDRCFSEIAAGSGPRSNRERLERFEKLLRRATAPEQEFLVRLVLGELRQGALEGLMAEAVARAAQLPAADVKRAAMLAGNLPTAARAALVEGAAGLARFRLELFRPLQLMLAQPGDDLDGALSRLGTAAIETKLDGARVQVHRSGDDVRVYSRQGRDVTRSVPEVVEAVLGARARELLLDGEVLALHADGRPQPFQVTMQRFGRDRELDAGRDEPRLTPFFFDLLHLDGQELIDRPASERFAALRAVLPEHEIQRLVTSDPQAAREFLRCALDRGHEGVMLKALDAPYEAGMRGASWLKLKPAHTLDLVVLAAELGSGRRRGWLSNLHLGARDPASGSFVMLGKTFKGMTDEMLRWQTEKLGQLEIRREDHVVYVRPELVVEIAFSDVQRSPRYPAGLALRFARVRRYRPDKRPDEADTIETVRAVAERGHRAA